MRKLVFLLLVIAATSCNREEQHSKVSHKQNVWVFMMAGQSNMAGRGLVEPQDTVPNKRVLTINQNNEIILAKEPIHFYEPTMAGLDCGLTFGKELTRQVPDSISVLLIPTAVGGSKISQWLGDCLHRDVHLLTNFKEKVKLGEKYGAIKGILWLQGESDANETDCPLYLSRLTDLMATFRDVINNQEFPVMIGEIGSFSSNVYFLKINEQIEAYSRTDSHCMIIPTSDLKDRGDHLHFNSEGQRLLGKRYAEAYINTVYKTSTN